MPLHQTASWRALQDHYQQVKHLHLRDLFAAEPCRFERFHAKACGILLDYSKNRITLETRRLLLELALQAGVMQQAQRLYAGAAINTSENQAACFPLLRDQGSAAVCMVNDALRQPVKGVLARMHAFADSVSSGAWCGYSGETITDVVSIGIGGSDWGPRVVCRALHPYRQHAIALHFVASLDASDLYQTLAALRPQRTLFVITSKSFNTQETLSNATSAKTWLLRAYGGDQRALERHFVAVSANLEAVSAFGIANRNQFAIWPWVGGRYSLWSAAGLPIAIGIGGDAMHQLLAGAQAMDQHFLNAPAEANLPLLLGLLGVWYINFFAAETHAVLPYDHYLEHFPGYLQQLEMESNGKSVTAAGEAVGYHTGAIVWGAEGSIGQHTFYQLLHQGTRLVPVDFVVAARPRATDHAQRHRLLLANCLAHSKALMQGHSETQARALLKARGIDGDALERITPHAILPGNKPSNTLLCETFDAYCLGALIALYELKTFVQGTIWRINSFDQWGVEAGKQLSASIAAELASGSAPRSTQDASTRALMSYCKHLQQRR